MGNICRSPSAEGIFSFHLENSSLASEIAIDSAGTHSYHTGNPPDPRAIRAVSEYRVDISQLFARRVRDSDFSHFDIIIAMDQDNLENLERQRNSLGLEGERAELRLMMEFSPRWENTREVPDPYYGEMDGFQYMCELLDEASQGLIEHLAAKLRPGEGGGPAGA